MQPFLVVAQLYANLQVIFNSCFFLADALIKYLRLW